jgi:hypothetical protein
MKGTLSNPHGDNGALPPELVEYMSSRETAGRIAAKYGLSPATLTNRAKKFGVLLRGRGRRAASSPNLKHSLILSLTQHLTYEEVGRKAGCSKQRIHHIVKRWKHLLPKEEAMAKDEFNPGDYSRS